MRSTRVSVALVVLALGLTGCLKSRSQIRQENDNPDSGYTTEVKEISTTDKSQEVVEELRGEINQLNGRIDELQKKNEDLSKLNEKSAQREQQIRDLDAKLQELQASQAAMIDALQKREQERQERLKQAEKEKEVPKAEPSDAFAEGRAAYKKKDYDVAIESMSKYLKYPKGKNVEEALFVRGEAYFATEQYKKAILDYDALREKHPRSKSVPKATLKMAESFDALGMKSDAKAFYQELVDKYPKTSEAKTAKAKLK